MHSNLLALTRGWTAITMGAIVLGCGEANFGPTGSPTIVIQGLLSLEAQQQSIWVEWSTPSDSAFSSTIRPIDGTTVSLDLILPTGDGVPFEPSETPGRFDAVVEVAPGNTYRLIGRVAGIPISAETVVPGPLRIVAPADDTLTVSLSTCQLFCEVPYSWHADRASGYEYISGPAGGQSGATRTATHEAAGVLKLLPLSGKSALTVVAYDQNASSFLLASSPKSSISGGFGFFGAASTARRVVVWE